MHNIALAEQDLGKIDAVLARGAGYESVIGERRRHAVVRTGGVA
jgi:hypothetical protein